jgi:hypothetical protein
MKKGAATKAREAVLKEKWNTQKDRRAARLDLNWRADELADRDVWRRRTPPPGRDASA